MEQQWTTVIRPRGRWESLPWKELLQYRDLIILFVRRNVSIRFKQTVLGPLWLVLTPLISTLISTFVFGYVARIGSGTVPYAVFYFCGFTLWSYFTGCLTSTANTFRSNAHLFGKVYFPRLAMPIASVITGLITLSINGALLIIMMVVYSLNGATFQPNLALLLLPFLILETAVLGLGVGVLISALTVKYRDLQALVGFGVDLWKYVTPVIYMSSSLGEYSFLGLLNPMSPIIEAFRYACLGAGAGEIMWGHLGISVVETLVVLLLGVRLFSHVEKTFIDTV